MKTIKIHDKDYTPVNERVGYFRSESAYEGWSITCDILSDDGKRVVMRASVKLPSDFEIASGIASEVEGSSNINKTSHYENCETSAIGRALGCLGIGIDDSYGSANEVQQAIAGQSDKASDKQRGLIETLLKKANINEAESKNIWAKLEDPDMTKAEASKAIDFLNAKK